MLHSTPAAALPLPRNLRAPSLRFAEKRSRAATNTSFTNALLPITAPSVKYLTRQRNIAANFKSGKTVPLSFPSNASLSVAAVCDRRFEADSAFPLLRCSANPINRR
ncbi:MAG: hypothetical protein ACRDBP_17505, partial [Luteolibacter sp.]